MPTRRAYVYSMQFHKTYVTSLEELNFVRKNDLKNMQSECETLKLRKNNLLENIANQIRY